MRPCGRCGQKPGHALIRWGAVLALGAALEAEAVVGRRHQHTASQATRDIFRTKTPCGRKVFGVAWILLSCWFADHILRSSHNYPR